MPDHVSDGVLLVGAGPMAVAYAQVLQAQGQPFSVVGRGESSCRAFEAATGIPARHGGLDVIRDAGPSAAHVIVAVGVDQLAAVTLQLLDTGFQSLLVEKPGGLSIDDLEAVAAATRTRNARVSIAYNRRYYSSVLKAKEIIAEDGGATSFSFDFTEVLARVEAVPRPAVVMENWVFANSFHVVDLAFHLGGWPEHWTAESHGALPWHDRGTVFAGCGRTETGALFTYSADWEAPGRWGVEVASRKHRLVLRPLEELRCQQLGSFSLDEIVLADEVDRTFKPGLYREVEAFLSGEPTELPDAEDQLRAWEIYQKIAPTRR